jgi:signal transduction histidine kinase
LNYPGDAQPSLRVPGVSWGRVREGEHTVQFYESDAYLLEALRGFFAPGLRDGEAAVVVATEPHREGLAALLDADGIDVVGLTAAGRYVALDATAVLNLFMRGGMPDAPQFGSTVGALVARLTREGRPVRVYGEMVSILWEDDQEAAALRLEELWNDLQRRYPFSLCCGYRMAGFAGRGMTTAFADVCGHHSRVHPAEGYDSAASEDDRLRAVARLQQRALEAEREAQEAIRMRDDFLVAASHDLKTPLAVILGHAQMLARRMGAERTVDARISEGLKSIERRARMMAAVVEELADATRLETGAEIVLHRELIDLSELVEEMAAEQQRSAPRHRLVLDIRDRPLIGFWDHVRITRVIVNLIGNAIKYSPDGGEITVRLEREADSWAVLSVHDPGIGIPGNDLTHVFDRFFRAANALGATAGTGIGLSTARHIVEKHGGTIEVESTEHVGSTFVVRLPLTSRPDSAQS